MSGIDWLVATMVGDEDTVIGRATYEKEWSIWIDMSGTDTENAIYVTGLDEEGIDIDSEQFQIYAPEITFVSLKGYAVALSLKKEGAFLSCKYFIAT